MPNLRAINNADEHDSAREDPNALGIPCDLAAEQTTLGAMMMSMEAIAEVVDTLDGPEDFYRPAHREIYDAITTCYLDNRCPPGGRLDEQIVGDELTRRGAILRVGGPAYLNDLLQATPIAANVSFYAHQVREKSVLRTIVETAQRMHSLATSDSTDSEDILESATNALSSITNRDSNEVVEAAPLLEKTIEELGDIQRNGGPSTGVPTGYTDLDALTLGLHPGQMVIVAARPGVGKSTVGVDFARSAAIKHGLGAVIFSLEMGRSEIMQRVLSAEASVRLDNMRAGRMSDDDWVRIERRMSSISEAPLFIDDSPNLTMMEIRAKARRLKQRHDIQLIVVDYMQLMTSGKR
ncbi:replicative DNA helicase, partial [Saccharopolyspora griseoalba]